MREESAKRIEAERRHKAAVKKVGGGAESAAAAAATTAAVGRKSERLKVVAVALWLMWGRAGRLCVVASAYSVRCALLVCQLVVVFHYV
jgi:hypothetical protein